MDRQPPVFFCDVDGVTAPFMPAPDLLVEGHDIRPFSTVMVRPDTIAALIALQGSGLVEFRWLTSWMESARTCFAPAIGMADFPAYADHGPLDSFSHLWWKEAVIRRFCRDEPGRHFIWADDDMNDPEHDQFTADGGTYIPSAQVELDHPGLGLMICPDINAGLSVDDIDHIERFARRVIGQHDPDILVG